MSTAGATRIETPDVIARSGVFRSVLRNPLGVVSLSFLLVVALAGVLGPFVAPFDPNHSVLATALQSPSLAHPLGTDSAGRDILSRLLVGARTTLLSTALAALVATAIGVPSGLVGGYFAGWFDSVASWCANVLMSLPSIVILLAVSAALGTSVWISMAVFGVLMSPDTFRLTRATVQSVREELYVDAARVAGLSDARILGRHILFVVRPPLIIQLAHVCGIAIAIQAGLQFLGLGDPLTPTWGLMLNEGFVNIYRAPRLLVWPGLAISVTTCAFAIFGNAVRDALEDSPRVQRHRRAALRSSRASLPTETREHGESLLRVTNLSVGYPDAVSGVRNVVSGVSFTVERGEVLGIVGESGSGKSQTVFSVLGLLPSGGEITGGSIIFDRASLVAAPGHVVRDELTRLRGTRISYIPQEPTSNLDPNFTVGYQLVRPMVKVLGLGRKDAKNRALDLLDTVGIDDPMRTFESYPHEVSGGMAQRVLIAGAVSCEPDLLIADEPTTALDVTVQAEVLDLLRDLQTRLQMALVLVTHNFGVVADLCDRVLVMQDGRVVESGDVRSVLRTPREEYTKLLLAAMLEGKPPLTMLTGKPVKSAVAHSGTLVAINDGGRDD